MTVTASKTVIDALQESFTGALRSPDGTATPVALLWTDADGQWRPLVPALMKVIPELYALGSFAPNERRGPVIWLKCIIERSLPDSSPPADVVPIIYLPNVSRQALRAGGDCPAYLQPLIELQYRGAVWHQRNGRDWTVDAFLTSEDGVGLDIGRDNRTRDAMLRALALLAPEPLAGLRGRRLEADDFDRLAIGDPVRDLLSWMSDKDGFEGRCDPNRWATFKDICWREFSFDPDEDGIQGAADALLHGGGKWDDVWRRFCDAPRLYPGVSAALRQARPRDLLGLADHSRRPGLNEEQEDRLRKALEATLSLPHAQACDKVEKLDNEHKERRGWVWAQLGESPYAVALEPLGRLAKAAKITLGGSTAEAIAADYASHGWRCDRAAMEALCRLKQGAENGLVTRVVRALYEPWLDRSARRFQELMSTPGVDPHKLTTAVSAERDTCVLFADGLRFDVGAILRERLEAQGLRVRISHRIAPIPTVTATAKPVASPAHRWCSGKADAEDFAPIITSSSQPANASRLRDVMARAGIEILDQDQSKMAVSGEGGGWTEGGKLDTLGHSLDALLVRQIDPEIDSLLDRISELLNAGWNKVRVVTDHGWLLLPGGLPKVELSPHLVATKWSRCAAVKGGSAPSIPTYPWYWNPVLRIASPPGIGAFVANTEYAHGGISLQECVIPELIVERGEEAVTATITEISWRGMRCRVAVKSNAVGVQVDLRLNWKQAASSIVAATKEVGSNGEASLAVSDDKHEGAAASVVITDTSGRVLDSKPTTVGEDA
ncbi:BREX-1 system phosphatase PglZ type B [Bradyrhizobium sp. 183]|uniref:BREX-1 system phosphatase PglZ type B n=1 Tax=unclassified Bradyrhizobium TaxID=2631580 RepID=UPI001FFFEC0F|nr:MULTISPECIES: BREX-1 system phosphatase PglZ type B [unclassified Bradyrhizobium]UPJ79824.1 BREX-1 system phosphatase PglZ type B [Bradyrhizobium sp. 184]UPJ87619.1 BREX-1 system phosphatase PglZ type B [Bradyrhizobium sp. 183]